MDERLLPGRLGPDSRTRVSRYAGSRRNSPTKASATAPERALAFQAIGLLLRPLLAAESQAPVIYGCFCAQYPFAHQALQHSLAARHIVPRARHSPAGATPGVPAACAFVAPV
jgi:hypothetical protein